MLLEKHAKESKIVRKGSSHSEERKPKRGVVKSKAERRGCEMDSPGRRWKKRRTSEIRQAEATSRRIRPSAWTHPPRASHALPVQQQQHQRLAQHHPEQPQRWGPGCPGGSSWLE